MECDSSCWKMASDPYLCLRGGLEDNTEPEQLNLDVRDMVPNKQIDDR